VPAPVAGITSRCSRSTTELFNTRPASEKRSALSGDTHRATGSSSDSADALPTYFEGPGQVVGQREEQMTLSLGIDAILRGQQRTQRGALLGQVVLEESRQPAVDPITARVAHEAVFKPTTEHRPLGPREIGLVKAEGPPP